MSSASVKTPSLIHIMLINFAQILRWHWKGGLKTVLNLEITTKDWIQHERLKKKILLWTVLINKYSILILFFKKNVGVFFRCFTLAGGMHFWRYKCTSFSMFAISAFSLKATFFLMQFSVDFIQFSIFYSHIRIYFEEIEMSPNQIKPFDAKKKRNYLVTMKFPIILLKCHNFSPKVHFFCCFQNVFIWKVNLKSPTLIKTFHHFKWSDLF